MEPGEVIQENEENYEIRTEEIKSVKLRGRGFDPGSDKRKPNKMEIVWSGGKEKFKFEKQTVNRVKEILKPVLGRKLN